MPAAISRFLTILVSASALLAACRRDGPAEADLPAGVRTRAVATGLPAGAGVVVSGYDVEGFWTRLQGSRLYKDLNAIEGVRAFIQREVLPNLLFEVAYAGNRGVRQPNRWDANPARQDADLTNPTPAQSRRPYQNVGFVSGNTSRAWSNYNALNLRLERRYTGGLSILGVYTWSKAMAIRPFDNWTVMDINNIRMNYGPVNDFTHNAVISYVYDLPFGKGQRFSTSSRAGFSGSPLKCWLMVSWSAQGLPPVRAAI